MRPHHAERPAQPLPARPWRRRAPRLRQKSAATYIVNALIVGLGLISPFTIRIVGNLPVGEVAFLVILPLLLIVRKARAFGGRRNIVLALISLWLVGQIITDVYRHTDRYDWMRGQATIAFFLIDFICLAILTRDSPVRKVEFLMAFSIGTILTIRYQPTEMMSDYPWKFGYALPITIFLLSAASYFYRSRAYPVVLTLFGMLIFFNLVFNYRSEILFLFVTVVLVAPLLPERVGRIRLLPRQNSMARVFVLAGLAVLGSGLAIVVIGYVTSSGFLGQQAQKKNQSQLQSKQGLLLSGRPEILVSSQAVLDSPILGHGSWAKDPQYAEMLHDLEVRYGMTNIDDMDYVLEETNGLIPAHSHIMGAWVFAGIAGVPIWIYLFLITVKAITQIYLRRPTLTPLYGWLFVSLLWAILFSPFGSTVRITEAITINIVIDLLNESDGAGVLKSIRKSGKWKRKIRRSATHIANLQTQ